MKKFKRGLALMLAVILVMSNGIYSMSSSLMANEADASAQEGVEAVVEEQTEPDINTEGVEVSIEEPSEEQAPVEEPSQDQALVEEQPTEQVPVEEQPTEQLPSVEQAPVEEEQAEQVPAVNKFHVTIYKPVLEGGIVKTWTTGDKAEVAYDGNQQYQAEVEEGTPFNVEIAVNDKFTLDKVTDQDNNPINAKSVTDNLYTYELTSLSADTQLHIIYKEVTPTGQPEEVAMPEQILEAKAGDITVKITAPEGALPEGTTLNTKAPSSKEVETAIEAQVETEGKQLNDVDAVEVTLQDKEGNTIQPKQDVTVALDGFKTSDTATQAGIYSVDNSTSAKIMDTDAKDGSVEFQTRQMSTFAKAMMADTETTSVRTPASSDFQLGVGENRTIEVETPAPIGGSVVADVFSSDENIVWSPSFSRSIKRHPSDPNKGIASATLQGVKTGLALVTFNMLINSEWVTQSYVVNVGESEGTESTVTFKANGADGKDVSYELKGGVDGEASMTLPDPADIGITHPEGYMFAGWSEVATGKGPNYVAKIQHTFTGPTTMHAIWLDPNASNGVGASFYIRNDGIVPFEPSNYGGGLFYPDSGAMPHPGGKPYFIGTLKTAVAVNNNLAAVKANLQSSPSDQEIVNTLAAYGVEFDPKTQEVVWYVIKTDNQPPNGSPAGTQWWHVDGVVRNKSQYTVDYKSNGGDGIIPVAEQHEAADSVTVKFDKTPSRSGYNFLGWSEDENATAATYTEAGTKTFTMPSKNVNLYAVWAPKSAVTFTAEHYIGSGDDYSKYSLHTTSTPKVAAGAGITSSHYQMEIEGYTYATADPTTAIVNGDGTTKIRLYYKSSANAKIDFNTNGGTPQPDSITGAVGELIAQTMPTGLKKTDYTFAGWYDNAKLEGNAVETLPATFPEGTTTYYAKWTRDIGGFKAGGFTKEYDGLERSITFTGKLLETESVQYTYGNVLAGPWIDGLASETNVTTASDNRGKSVYVRVVDGEGNVVWTSQEKFITITARALEIKGESKLDAIYNGTPYHLTGVTEENLVEKHTTNVTALAKGTKVGTYPGTITAKEDVKIFDAEANEVTKNYKITTTAGTLIINPADATGNEVTFTGSVTGYDGTEKQLAAAVPSVVEGTTLYYTATPEDESSWSETMPVFTNAGSYTVHVKAVNDNFGDYTTSATLDIKKRDITISGESKLDAVYTGTPYRLTGVTSGPDQLVADHRIEAEALVEGTDVGHYTGTITEANGVKIYDGSNEEVTANYNIKTDCGVLEIFKADAALNAVTIIDDTVEYDSTEHQLDAATTLIKEGTEIYYSLTPDIPQNFSQKMPSFIEAGEYTIYVKATNPNYNNAVGEAVLTIKQRPLELVGKGNENAVYTGAKQTISGHDIVGKDVVGEHKITAEASVSGTDVGEYTGTITAKDAVVIKAGDKDVTKNYDVTTKAGKLNIVKAPASQNRPNIADDTFVYDGTEKQLEKATAKPGSTLTYSIDGGVFTSDMPTKVEAGTYTVTVKATNPNYHDATGTATMIIQQRKVSFVGESGTREYTGVEQSLTDVSFGENQLVHGHSHNVTASAKGIIVDTYLGTITEKADVVIMNGTEDVTRNYEITTAAGKLIITQAAASANPITIESLEKEYNGAMQKLADATAAQTGSEITYATEAGKEANDWTAEMPEFKNVGIHKVYVKASNQNYETSTAEATLTITARVLEIKGESGTRTYTGSEHKLEGVIADKLVTKHKTNVTAFAKGTQVGTYAGTITAKEDVKIFDAEANEVTQNYKITTTAGTLIINPADATGNEVTFTGSVTGYDGTEKQLAAAVPSVVEGTTLYYTATPENESSWSATMPTFTDAGSYIVYVKAVNDNFKDYTTSATLKIDKRDITISGESKLDAIYNGTQYRLTGVTSGTDQLVTGHGIEAEALVEGTDAKTYTGAITEAAKVKIYDAIGKPVTGNYKIITVPGTLKISKADAALNAVTVTEKTAEYDGTEHKLKTPTTLVEEGTKIYYSTDGTNWEEEMPTFTDAGTYPIYVKATNPNYEDAFETTNVIINKRPLALTGKSMTDAIYNGETQQISGYDIVGKDVVGEQQITAAASVSGTNVGTYTGIITAKDDVVIKDGDKDVTKNYDITTTSGKLIIFGAVIYNNNGATDGKEPNDTKPYAYGDNVSVAEQGDLLRANALFLGWSQEKYELITSQNQEDEAMSKIVSTVQMGEKSIELYAVWAIDTNGPEGTPNEMPDYKEFAVSYNGNGGTGTMTDGNVYPKEWAYTVKPNEFTNPGNVFVGWNTEGNGSGTSYAPGTILGIAGATTLYAQWEVDVIGEGENPDVSDNIPDRYQVMVNFAAVNGTVSIDRTVVTLRDEAGNLSETGTGRLGRVAAATASNGFNQESIAWNTAPTLNMTISRATTFTATFAAVAPGTPITPTPTPTTTTEETTTPPPAAAPVTPAAVVQTILAPVTELVENAADAVEAAVEEIVQVDDENVPLANRQSNDHKCCILHFLIILLALLVEIVYTRSMKKRQQRIFELREELAMVEDGLEEGRTGEHIA